MEKAVENNISGG